MLTDLSNSLYNFIQTFRRAAPLPLDILLPGLLILFVWPLLRVGLDDARAAFMVAFIAAMALRFALRAETQIRQTRRLMTSRTTVIVVLLSGPGLLTALITLSDPMACQRFLSLYFLLMSALYTIDVITGRAALVRFNWPDPQMRSADATLTRVMAIYHLAMVLLNETLIQHASQTTWLLYFGLLPLLSHVVTAALIRTVQDGIDTGAHA
jgi:intracellular septation protein A